VGPHIQLSDLALGSPNLVTSGLMTQEGFGQAYLRGFTRTVRLLLSRGASMNDAEDAAQTAWLQGWRKIDQLRDERMIVSWVSTIAINYHRRGFQHQARYRALTDLSVHIGMDVAPPNTMKMDAAKILKFCRPADRILFEHQLGGLTTEEIARKQRASATAIRIRLLRARRTVRKSLEDRAVELRRSFQRQERAAVAG
jgi:DNA-directed RNA polymerase specialized sigma24 family protein